MKETQTEFFKKEGHQYYLRNHKDIDMTIEPPMPDLKKILANNKIELDGGSVLELGCGAANNLNFIKQEFGAKRLVGTEPSGDTVKILQETFPDFEFLVNNSLTLPFENDEFDMVITRGVLCWIERPRLLQVLSEILRVSKTYILISEYCPSSPYSTIYSHNTKFRTYKMSYRKIMEGTNLVSEIDTFITNSEDDWKRSESSLYRKLSLDEAFPIKDESDFISEI